MRPIVYLLSICLLLASTHVWSACETGIPSTVVYGNGINTSPEDAQRSLDRVLYPAILGSLPPDVDRSCLSPWLAYDSKFLNSDNQVVSFGNLLLQLVDAGVQRGIDLAANFWGYWDLLVEPPTWFQETQQAYIAAAASVFQPDLLKHEAFYNAELGLGHRLSAVTHSQGNLYVNQAYDVVTSLGGADRFNVVAVATPAPRVAGSGPHITLRGDVILAVPGSLPWNVQNDLPSPCPANVGGAGSIACHSFDTSYMAGNRTRPAIVEAVVRTLPKANRIVTVSPPSGSWDSSPQDLSITSSGATTIYYTMVNTYDGSTPSEPEAPSPSSNNGSIAGSSGLLQLYGSVGQIKRFKIRFLGCSSSGCGAPSDSYQYQIDLGATNQRSAVFRGLGDLPGGSRYSRASAVSGDGRIVVGESDSGTGREAFLWTAAEDMQGLGNGDGAYFQSSASGVSADGQVVVGYGQKDGALGTEAFRWTRDGGMQGLGYLADMGAGSTSVARGVSADGTTVVGESFNSLSLEAFRWTASAGMQGMGDLVGGPFTSSAYGISRDGGTIVGDSQTASGLEAFRWTASTGMQSLGGTNYTAYGVSADGRTASSARKNSSAGRSPRRPSIRERS